MEMLTIPKDRQEKVAFWKAHFDAYQKTDLNLTAFCKSRGIFMQSFRKWLHHFSEDNNAAENHNDSQSDFIRVPLPQVDEQQSKIQCVLPNGVQLTWDAGVSSQKIVELIRVVTL